jgi:hypothetical protein
MKLTQAKAPVYRDASGAKHNIANDGSTMEFPTKPLPGIRTQGIPFSNDTTG